MKPQSFSLRIDIDSLVGLRNGVPKILDLLGEYGIKASFFSVMGWEGDLFSVLKHRFFYSNKNFPRFEYATNEWF